MLTGVAITLITVLQSSPEDMNKELRDDSHTEPLKAGPTSTRRYFRPRWLLLMLPYFALCFPQLYARNTPVVFGFPFFYWYQFLWVVLTSLLLGIYYRLTQRPD